MLLDSLADHLASWGKPKSSKRSTEVQLGDVSVTLSYCPLRLEVTRGRDVLLTFNSRSLFQMEHLREKQVLFCEQQAVVDSCCRLSFTSRMENSTISGAAEEGVPMTNNETLLVFPAVLLYLWLIQLREHPIRKYDRYVMGL